MNERGAIYLAGAALLLAAMIYFARRDVLKGKDQDQRHEQADFLESE
jgi:hypothetical protein